MYELRKCPFCGSDAEMRYGEFPAVRKALCKSKEQAESVLEEHKKRGTVVQSGIYQRERRYKDKWCAYTVHRAYIPRCTNNKCIARASIKFFSEELAAEFWNGGADGCLMQSASRK